MLIQYIIWITFCVQNKKFDETFTVSSNFLSVMSMRIAATILFSAFSAITRRPYPQLFIPQTIYLMDDTIKNNIAFGIEEKEIDPARLKYAVEQAQLSQLIEELEFGLDTKIGEMGVRLSGGQRQRIGIARALYHNPEILVLDEATSALDNETEKAVMDAIETLHGKMTLIIIAHRLSTIKDCDYVYEIGDGKATQK